MWQQPTCADEAPFRGTPLAVGWARVRIVGDGRHEPWERRKGQLSGDTNGRLALCGTRRRHRGSVTRAAVNHWIGRCVNPLPRPATPEPVREGHPRRGTLRALLVSIGLAIFVIGSLALVHVGFAIVVLGLATFLLLQYLLWGWWLYWLVDRADRSRKHQLATPEPSATPVNGSEAVAWAGDRRRTGD